MKFKSVKGTRDFYPAEMAMRNWIIDGWKKVSLRNGFVEYDGPILEYLKMFQIKSGDEIAEQLFSMTDRGGRELAIRPEITPTLARMVNQRINSLPRPIKWFSVPRLCRAERPQQGRLREFFQWNIDIIGFDDVLADAEVIFCTLDYLRQAGLTPDDIRVKISSRKLLSAFLKNIGVPEDKLDALYLVLDKKSKLSAESFGQILKEQVEESKTAEKIRKFMETKKLSEIEKMLDINNETGQAINELLVLNDWLLKMEVGEYCKFDPSIIRGLAYYTGVVFEVHDVAGDLRAIAGGGRFDNLLCDFGGPDIPATGMGMGDCVLEVLLERKGLIDKQVPKIGLDYFIVSAGNITFVDEKGVVSTPKDEAVKLTVKLRNLGFAADFSYKSGSLSKQLKEASMRNASKCIIIGEEFKRNELMVKDMTTGNQKQMATDNFFSTLIRI